MNNKIGSHLSSLTSLVTLYVDGASRGNPGHAAVGLVIKSGKKLLLEDKEYIGCKTNNEAEYIALILGLGKTIAYGNKVRVISDSELLVNQVKGLYKVKQTHLKDLFEKVRKIQKEFEYFEINHCQREQNREADKLANKAIDEFLEGKRKEVNLEYNRQDKLF